MNWKLIGGLSLFGLAMAFATVWIIPPMIEPVCWLAIFLVCAAVIARMRKDKHFLHGLFVSLANCVYMTGAHFVFADTYLMNHPQEAAMSTVLAPRIMMLIVGPMIGLVSGIVLGGLSWLASKVIKPAV